MSIFKNFLNHKILCIFLLHNTITDVIINTIQGDIIEYYATQSAGDIAKKPEKTRRKQLMYAWEKVEER